MKLQTFGLLDAESIYLGQEVGPRKSFVENGQCPRDSNTQSCVVFQWKLQIPTCANQHFMLKYDFNSVTLHFLTYKM